MGWSRVQGTGNAGLLSVPGASITATLSGVTAGNLLVLGVDAEASGATVPNLTVSDGTNSYSLAHGTGTTYDGGSGPSVRLALYSAKAASSGSYTITAFSTLSGLMTLSFEEYAPTGGSPTLDASGDANDSVAGDTSGSVTLSTAASDLVVGIFDVGSTGLTYSASTGYTKGYSQSGSSNRAYASVYSLATGPGSVSPGVSWGLLMTTWTGVAAAWRSDAVATATPGLTTSILRPVALPILDQYRRLY